MNGIDELARRIRDCAGRNAEMSPDLAVAIQVGMAAAFAGLLPAERAYVLARLYRNMGG